MLALLQELWPLAQLASLQAEPGAEPGLLQQARLEPFRATEPGLWLSALLELELWWVVAPASTPERLPPVSPLPEQLLVEPACYQQLRCRSGCVQGSAWGLVAQP